MCGLFASNDPLAKKCTSLITDESLRRRGPDYQSAIEEFNGWLLYHTRLGIQNPDSASANQPIETRNSGRMLFNGEIYNHESIEVDASTCIKSDTVLLAEGESFNLRSLDKLDGVFALIFINEKGVLEVCARDKLGVKPLYVYQRNEFITICSSAKVIASIFKFKHSNDAILEYEYFRGPIFKSSFYSEIHQVAPGTCYVQGEYYNIRHRFHEGKYRPLSIDNLKSDIQTACEKRISTEVLSGILFSGGVDSNLINSFLPHTYLKLIGGNAGSYDLEATKNHSNVLQVPITPDPFLKYLRHLRDLKSEPLSLPNEVVLSMLASQAKRRHIKILFSGDGADEVFSGYDRIFRASLDPDFNVNRFLEMYCYKSVDNFPKTLLETITQYFENMKFKTWFERVRCFFIEKHLPLLLGRLDFSLMSQGIEGREPFCDIKLVEHGLTISPDELLSDRLGKLPLRRMLSDFGNDLAYNKKFGFPINLLELLSKENEFESTYSLWRALNGDRS